MKKKLCVLAMMTGLMVWSCGQEEKKAEAPAPEPMTSVEQTMNTMEKEAEAVVEKVEESAGAVVAQVKEAVPAMEKKTAAVAEKVQEKAASVVAKKVTTTVETVVIDNSYGKITFSHKKHADVHGCTACHGDQKPGSLKLGKEAGHTLCQGCHKLKNGPTKCTQCHEKKAKPAGGGYGGGY